MMCMASAPTPAIFLFAMRTITVSALCVSGVALAASCGGRVHDDAVGAASSTADGAVGADDGDAAHLDANRDLRPDNADMEPLRMEWTRYPAPPDLWYNSVSGTAENDVWVSLGGWGNVVQHWNGADWSPRVPLGTCGTSARTLSAASADEVWAIGGNGACHWNGSDWTEHKFDTEHGYHGIWGDSRTGVWAVGTNRGFADVRRYAGGTWSRVMAGVGPSPLYAVWGLTPRSVWAVGERGTIARFNGAAWANEASGTEALLMAVWGSAETDVWAVGGGGTIVRRTAAGTWSVVPSGTSAALLSVWGSSPNDVWTVGYHPGEPNVGVILHWDGTQWRAVTADASTTALLSVWSSGPRDVWVVGHDGILHGRRK